MNIFDYDHHALKPRHSLLQWSILCIGFGVLVGFMTPCEANKQRIQDTLKQAQTATQNGQHKASAEAYRRAYTLSDESIYLYRAAESYYKAKMWVESYNYYQQFYDEDVGSDEGDRAQSQLQILREKLRAKNFQQRKTEKNPFYSEF